MDISKTKRQQVHVLMVSIAICFLFIPNCYSSLHNGTSIDMNGNWPSDADNIEADRALPTIPITAYLIDYYINIQNEKPDCDITVNIINSTTGDIAYQQVVPKAATANMMIPITNLPSGEYILELTGPSTRHLEGIFSK